MHAPCEILHPAAGRHSSACTVGWQDNFGSKQGWVYSLRVAADTLNASLLEIMNAFKPVDTDQQAMREA